MSTENMVLEPLVSILIVNYNYGQFIATAIESALSQTYSKIEVVVVDDGSTDNSREVIEDYYGRVRAIHIQNGGQSAATNVAFAASVGDIICLLDSDDYFVSDKVSKIVACYQRHEEAIYVFHALQRVDMNGADLGIKEPMDGSRRLDCKVKNFMAPPTTGLTFRRSAWNILKPMPEELSILGDNYFKFVIMGLANGYYLAEPLGVMRLHGDNLLSMGNWGISRFPAEVKVALAMRSNFPRLTAKTDRMVSITLARYWQLKSHDEPTSEKLQVYLRKSSARSKARIYGLAILRCCRQFLKATLAVSETTVRSRSVRGTLSSQTADRSSHD
jgi:glycosyltransferase involved in cell wall biosynthesis